MKVADLKALLDGLDPDTPVWLVVQDAPSGKKSDIQHYRLCTKGEGSLRTLKLGNAQWAGKPVLLLGEPDALLFTKPGFKEAP